MIELYFLIFFVSGLFWGFAIAPFQKPLTKNYFKIHIPNKAPPKTPQKTYNPGIVGEVNKLADQVKQAKVNFKRGKLA